MRKTLYKLATCALLLFGTVMSISARNGIIDTLQYRMCAGDTLILQTLREVKAYSDTVFYDTIPVARPTDDSIHMYLVHIYPTFRQIEHRQIVPGEAFSWRGEMIQQAGTYTNVYKTEHGCDSTHVLVVTEEEGIQMVLHSLNVIPFCDHVTYRGKSYSQTTTIVDTLRSLRYGCDSIATTILQKGVTFRHHEAVYLYAGETLTWHGQTITTAGTYYDQHIDRFGCDSIYDITVYMRAASRSYYTSTTLHSMCQGDVFNWRGIDHTIGGSYVDTVYNNLGKIDTLYVLQLTVNPHYEYNELVEFTSFPQYYRGMLISGPGTYPMHYTASTGCDSIINVIVNRQAIIHEETATICKGEEYVWRLHHLREAQTYKEIISAADGTDSIIYILHLNVHSIPVTHVTHTMCKGDSYVFGTQILTEPGTYRHTYKQDGCDSIVELSLNMGDVDTIIQVHRLNPGETYTWPATGRTYSGTGTYQVTHTNRFGCDSITRLVLTFHHVDTIDTVATICPGETLYWHTISASTTGHFENVETDAHGDMRYYRLDLTVRELKEEEISFFICGDETITFNGKTYSQAGHYYDKGACDTLYHIIVSQPPTQIYQTDAYLDGVNGYRWSFKRDGIETDSVFTTPGTYEFSNPNPTTGCNDIWRLVLSQDPNSYHFVEQVSLCEGEAFSWRGHDGLSLVPGTAVYTEHLYTRSGNDSIYELQVTVRPKQHGYRTINFCGSTVWQGKTYTSSAIVYDTLTAANGCDSIVEISLRKNNTFFRRDTATILQGEKLIWHGQNITTDGVYEDRQITQFGCDSIYELHVGIKPATPQTNMITEYAEICEGDYYEWRGHKYYNKGIYPDTVIAQTIEETDTIYVLNLNVTEVERRREQHFLCENESLGSLYGKDYNALIKTDTVYRDTVEVPNPAHMGCPDIVYLEIYKYPVKRHTETQILHPGETIHWNEQTITKGGDYINLTHNAGDTGCDSISVLHVVQDLREEVYVCMIDTPDLYPYVWREDTFYTSGIWFDTVFTAEGDIREFYSLDLTITQPVDTAVYLHGCENRGVVWHDQLFLNDTAFIDRIPVDPYNPKQPCDTVFHVHIFMDTTYVVNIVDTICEHELPYILGRQNIKEIWSEGFYRHTDMTMSGCDSIIYLTLRIIPSLEKNDSTFICEDDIKRHPVVLGNLEYPTFAASNGGEYTGSWAGKWRGVRYHSDTIVYNCDSSYSHHIIVRPSQKMVKDTTFFLCPGDSLRLFWGRGDDSTWFYKDTLYVEHTPMPSVWTDTHHQKHYAQDAYSCDSITRWHIQVLPRDRKDTIVHKLIGDSIWWGGAWRYYTGTYDSIGQSEHISSLGDTCVYDYSLHLYMDTVYYFRDTVDVCLAPHMTYTHTWYDGHEQQFTALEVPVERIHFYDSLVSYDRRDSIYDLCVSYRIIPTTHLYDTICEGDYIRWFSHHRDYTTSPRNLHYTGIYYDTVPGVNICDSVLILHLYVRPLIRIDSQRVEISDLELPYLWSHRWTHNAHDTTVVDTLRSSGLYTYTMPSVFGCDSTETLLFSVHQTHVFRDTIDICSGLDKTHTHIWSTGYEQTFNTPLMDDSVFYADTLLTRIPRDSIYVLCVNFHQNYLTEINDTICEGSTYRFDLHRGNTTIERWLNMSGTYWDTVETRYGCDSVIKLRLYVRDRVPVTQTTVHLPDTAFPYIWHHTWTEFGHVKDSTRILTESGDYGFHMYNQYGCDSIDSLHLYFHDTYRIKENDIVICESETPYTWQGRNDITKTCNLIYYGLTKDGYDSIRYVHIEVLPVPRTSYVHTICEGDIYKFGERYLTEQGTYHDTLVAANGCDSISTLILQVQPTLHQTDARTIFEGDSVLFYGEYYKQSGHYEYKTVNSQGCFDTHMLILTVLKSFNVDTTATICHNDLPFVWRGYEYNETGDYTLPIAYTDSSRVTKTLHLTVNDVYYSEKNIEMCAGNTYIFKGKEYTSSCTFFDTIPTLVGCDSVIKYVISMHPTYDRIDTVHISDKQPYTFHDRVLTNAGTYEWTGRTVHGCDSMEHLILIVHPSYFHSDTLEFCQGDTLHWLNGKYTIYESGVYYDSVLTVPYGFDSVHQVVVTFHPSYFLKEQYEIGVGEVLKIHGRDISQPAIYYDTLRTIHGCDSIFHVVVNQKRTREFTWNKEICQGEYFDFFGRKVTHTGQYKYTSQYKDSIVTLNLTVYPISITEKRQVITDKQLPYIYEGKIYEQGGIYNDTLVNHYGCDSICRFVLVVTSHYSDWIPMALCPGSEIKIDGQTITEAGLYSFIRRSKITGELDSIYRVEVYDAPAYDLPTEYRQICQGDTLYFAGKTITRGGHYDFNLKTTEGCDSIVHLDLTINTAYHFYRDVTIFDYQTYNWYGIDYDSTGVYSRTWPTIHDCDSTHTLRLTVLPTMREHTYDTICEGQEYTWRNKKYTQEGVYADTVANASAFESAIYTLSLEVVRPTFVTTAKGGEICADDREFSIEFTYSGEKPTTYSILFDQLAKDEGFVDVINKPFLGEDRLAYGNVPAKTEVIYLEHTTYVKPNRYSMSLVLDNGVCGISRSNDVELLVKYPSWIIEQNWNDIVVPIKQEWNGGYEFSKTDWYINGELQPNNGKGYLQHAFEDGDEVILSATRKGESYAIETCPLVIRINPNMAYDEPILVYPTQAPRHAPTITIDAPTEGQYEVYSSTGSLLMSHTFGQGETLVTLPGISGIYFIRTIHGKSTQTHKILLY